MPSTYSTGTYSTTNTSYYWTAPDQLAQIGNCLVCRRTLYADGYGHEILPGKFVCDTHKNK